MTVNELIKELEKAPSKAIVMRDADGVPIESVYIWAEDLEVFIA